MDRISRALEIVRSQRDSLTVAYHDLQVEHALLKESLKQTSDLLEQSRVLVAELERSMKQPAETAINAATDAAT